MQDLKDAIKKVIQNADCDTGAWWYVHIRDLENLVAEYNIYFVEPDQEQLKL